MISTVLIVDDDQSLLRLMEKELESYDGFFSVTTVPDGQGALHILSDEDVSLVLCDLRMPGIDGFELIGRIIKQYPHIPVMAMTAHDRPRTKDVVLKSGAVGYVIKPVDSTKLSKQIIKILNKKTEGGSLNRVSLGTYLQLIEIEEQTCTLRISDHTGKKNGVLFFKDGQLMDARIGNRSGREASYEILSWSDVSLAIENDCVVKEKHIDGEMQAILLDAMRSKDEGMDEDSENEWVAGKGEPAGENENRDAAANDDKTPSHDQNTSFPNEKLSLVNIAEQKIVSAMGKNHGIKDVYIDPRHEGLVYQVEKAGQVFGAGTLNVVYINRAREQALIIPGEENIVVVLDKNISRENLIAVFS